MTERSDEPRHDEDEEDLFQIDFVGVVRRYARAILTLTVLVGVVVAAAVGAYNWLQPSRWIADEGFRPVFEGADLGRYPNGLAFNATDIVNPSIVDQVFDANQLRSYCSRDDFRSAMYVQQTSSDLRFLDLDYSARLGDTRLTSVQRDQIEAEYRSKRAAMPVEFSLVFIRPAACKPIPRPVIFKALNDVLETWANDSDTKRGVLKLRVPVLTPAIFASSADSKQSALIRANAVRASLTRAIANLNQIELLPGAELIRYGKDSVTFAEVRGQLEDLLSLQLEPLLALAGANLSTEAKPWVQEMLAAAQIRAQRSETTLQGLTAALNAYSGTQMVSPGGSQAAPRSNPPADVQAMTTQIDQGFIDRIVALTADNTKFRQGITKQIVAASEYAVADRANVEYYSKLLQALQSRGSISAQEAERQLQDIVARGKDLIAQLDKLYDEFSRVSLRSAGAMYQVTTAPDVTLARALTLKQFIVTVLGAMGLALVFATLAALVHDRFKARA